MLEWCSRKHKYNPYGNDKDSPKLEDAIFNKEIKILKSTQAEMTVELKKLNNSTRKLKESLKIQWIKQKKESGLVEDRISGMVDKVEDLNQVRN